MSVPQIVQPSRQRLLAAGTLCVVILAAPLLFRSFFSSSFLPHAFCYAWDSRLIAVNVVADGLIGLSYVAIAATLVQLVRKTRFAVPFHWMFLAFGAFIIACGFTHFMEVVTLWQPVYWLSGYVKVITAAASLLTALTLPLVIPEIVAMTKAAAQSAQIKAELEASNLELEAFSYSVSHDLRAPLRAIDGFSRAVLEDSADKLGDQGKADLKRVCEAAKRMGLLIDDLLKLARTTRAEMSQTHVDLSRLAQEITASLRAENPSREAEFRIASGLAVEGDQGLLRVVLQNLLDNAWKFTRTKPKAAIEFGLVQQNGEKAYFVRDNGVGFDMKYAENLFAPFQRMHDAAEFSGTGIGLATVQRIVRRHGGRIWVDAAVDQGATFYFVLSSL